MRYRITHTTKYAYSEPVPVCQNKVHLAPVTSARQRCQEYHLLVIPDPSEIDVQTDFFGNRVEYFSVLNAHRGLAITAQSTIEVAAQPPVAVESSPIWEEIARSLIAPASAADYQAGLFGFASDCVTTGRLFAEFARDLFPPGKPILVAASDLTARIHQSFRYAPGATDVSTPVEEVLHRRMGVCQDFAHLEIACLRSLGLAARYVSGYLRTLPPPGKPRLIGADATHAWLSVYCGPLGWIDFDPTNNVIPATDHVTLAIGRDYADVCPIQGVFVGGGDQSMTVSVDVLPVG